MDLAAWARDLEAELDRQLLRDGEPVDGIHLFSLSEDELDRLLAILASLTEG